MTQSHHIAFRNLWFWIIVLTAVHSVNSSAEQTSQAIFAGGCFWCMEAPFDELDGVIDTISGYTGGHTSNPTYKEVSSGTSGHAEVVLVTYSQNKVSYQTLLSVFWRNIDPLDKGGQFCDRGSQYRSEIFAVNENQLKLASVSLQELNDSGRFNVPVETLISKAVTFYPAEDYHQNYYQTNPKRFKFYKWNCGRQQRLDQLWGRK
jgi:peptide-methionine (S)-S-oxide reductase